MLIFLEKKNSEILIHNILFWRTVSLISYLALVFILCKKKKKKSGGLLMIFYKKKKKKKVF